jgi:hypothetical protein
MAAVCISNSAGAVLTCACCCPDMCLLRRWCSLCWSTGRTGSTDSDDGSYDASSSGRIATAMPVVLDPMGYYELLGLKPDIEVGAAPGKHSCACPG